MLDAQRMLPLTGGRREICEDKLIDYLLTAIIMVIDLFIYVQKSSWLTTEKSSQF